MRKFELIPEETIKEMHTYYDAISAGICIQMYLDTEDGKGDFIPVYANQAFADSMGAPLEVIDKLTLRQISQGFPDKELRDMVEVAFDGRVINGDNFAKDCSKFFTVRISQFRPGYTIMFMSDITTGHITTTTLNSLSRSFCDIYYARVSEPICSKIYPVDGKDNVSNITYEELVERLIHEGKIHPDDKAKVSNYLDKENICKATAKEDCFNFMFRTVGDKEHEYFAVEVIVTERQDDKPVAFVITRKDVTELINKEHIRQHELEAAYEKAKKANESKDKFLNHMSHDLRTPLNGILGMIQLLEIEEPSEAVRHEYRQKIKEATNNLLNLFNSALEITRIDAGDFVLEKARFDVKHVRTELVNLLSNTDATFNIDIPEFKHQKRFGPEGYIRQIGIHLISNAVKFNKDNNPIDISIKEIGETENVKFIVKDRGIGMSEDFLSIVFEPFAQEHSDSRTTYEGSGLGLPYVKKILDLMGGTIEIESTQGEGTTVTVCFPLTIDYEWEKESHPDKEVKLEGRKALIVEDNDLNRMIVECFLETEKIESASAENGQIALDMFVNSSEDEYDFILMDVLMPVMNGLDATSAIRNSSHARAKTIPIIGVSANSFPEDIQKGIDAGMNAYIAKPVKKATLTDTIEECLK